jgi:predicted Fe-Mo cluster-binding NifX family protein
VTETTAGRKGELVKLAISATGPTLDSDIDQRFGRARFFIVLEGDGEAFEVIDNQGAGELPHGAGIATVERLVRGGVTAVITGEVGPKAEQGLRAAGIEVRTGATGTCRAALAALAPDWARTAGSAAP